MAAVPTQTETPSQRRLASTSKRLGIVLAALATIAVVLTIVFTVIQHDPNPAFKCVPAEGASGGQKSSNTNCSANTKTTGVGVTKPGAKPGAQSP